MLPSFVAGLREDARAFISTIGEKDSSDDDLVECLRNRCGIEELVDSETAGCL